MDNNRESIYKFFLKNHNVEFDVENNEDNQLIYWLTKLGTKLNKNIEEKDLGRLSSEEPTWVILLSMLHRVFENTEGVIISYFTGCWSSVEILARVVMESSVNVMYVLDCNKSDRLTQYLNYYFNECEKRINKYLNEIDSIPDSEKTDFFQAAERSRKILKERKKYLFKILKTDNIHSNTDKSSWLNAYDRFKYFNLQVDYRQYYSTLSSQVHNDAESLIDYILFKSIQGIDNNIKVKEVHNWIRLYSYIALKYLSLATSKYSAAYGLDNSKQYAEHIEETVIIILNKIYGEIF
jgi:hypothetical protein